MAEIWARAGDLRPLTERWALAASELRALGGTMPVPMTEPMLDVALAEIKRLTPKPQPPAAQYPDPRLARAQKSFFDTLRRYRGAEAEVREAQKTVRLHSLRETPEHRALADLDDPALMEPPQPIQEIINAALGPQPLKSDSSWWSVREMDTVEEYRAAEDKITPHADRIDAVYSRLSDALAFERMPAGDKLRHILLAMSGKVRALDAQLLELRRQVTALSQRKKGKK
jgi:hypothetical protein